MNIPPLESYPEEEIQEWLDDLRPYLCRLLDIWGMRSFSHDTIVSYLKQAKEHVQDLMTEMISESEAKAQTLIHEIKHLRETLDKLSKELNKTVDLSACEDLPLDTVKEKLNEEVKVLKVYKEELMNRYKQLRAREHNICKKTGVKPINFKKNILTEHDLEQFMYYLDIQENEKDRLEIEFYLLHDQIISMMHKLQCLPENEFQKQVYTDPDNFVYTKENMQLLLDWKNQLETHVQEFCKLIQEKKDEVKALWTYLEESPEYCQQFLNKYSAENQDTYKALEAEIERCKKRRTDNIAKYIDKMKQDLEIYWDLCKYSDVQRNNFAPINNQDCTESLLALYESEVQRLRKFYNQNKKIFDLIQDFESIIEQMKILDRRAMDPDRLNNRGGQLLAEEKERKIANKKLPKIQDQIMQCTKEYERVYDDNFTVYGLTIDEYFTKIWDEYNKDRENIKSEVRKQAKDKSAKNTPLMSANKTPRIHSTRLGDQTKSSRKKLFDETSASSQTVSSKSKLINKKAQMIKLKRGLRTKTVNDGKVQRGLYKSNTPGLDDGESMNSSYEEFQQHLQLHDDLRSSCLPNDRGVHKMKTPVKTPVNPLRKVLQHKNAQSKIALRSCNISSSPGRTLSTDSSKKEGASSSHKSRIKLQLTPGNIPLFL